LLSWLHANHCSVILLSATLPSSRRRQLIEAWGGALPENKVSYPRLTWIDERGTQSLSIAEPQEKTESKIVHLADAPGDGSTLAATLKNKLNDGGCAAIICNTVKSAQALYAHLKAELGEDFCDQDEWHLFHARMPFAWRQEREAKILKSFGKDKTHRAQRAIAISTQVMEQSLDLDFDWMASELAPIDLLLQRAGRLHRHAHTVRPAALQEAELMVLCDAGENGAPPRLDVPDAMYAHFILLQTWLALRARAGVLRLPDDIETLIEVVYETCLPAPDQVWEEALKTTWDAMHSSRREANAKARNVLIHKPQDARSIANAPSRELREDDDPETHQTLRAATREGDPSLQVVCLVREGDALYLPSNDGSADRAQPVDLQRNPHRDQTRALLRNALPLSNKALYFALLAEAAPTGWKENAHLRFARALEFCEGQTRIAGRTLRLDGELGLVIEKNQ
jgi:CRISPR-associated endonuclease/helicase Cas3